jgi:hypothetical protein
MWSTLDLPSLYVVNPGPPCGSKEGEGFPSMWSTLVLPVEVRKGKGSPVCGQPWTSLQEVKKGKGSPVCGQPWTSVWK